MGELEAFFSVEESASSVIFFLAAGFLQIRWGDVVRFLRVFHILLLRWMDGWDCDFQPCEGRRGRGLFRRSVVPVAD